MADIEDTMDDVLNIRENITPRGDGNYILSLVLLLIFFNSIRENITPRGDGNSSNV